MASNEDNTDAIGKRGQKNVMQWLRHRRFSIHETGNWAPFDLYTASGTTLEVKVGTAFMHHRRLGWAFHIARHGKMCIENCIDFYVFRLEPGPKLMHLGMDKAMHIVVPASAVKVGYVWISLRSLFTSYAQYVDKTEAITVCDQGKTIHDLATVMVRADRNSSQSARRQKVRPPRQDRVSEAERQVARDRLQELHRAALMEKITTGEKSPAELELDQEKGSK